MKVISSLYNNSKFSSELFIWELGYIKKLIELKIPFEYGKINYNDKNKILFWSPSLEFAPKNEYDYPTYLVNLAKKLEFNGNKIFNTSDEIEWLENKFFMYKKFDELKINFPKTWLFISKNKIDFKSLSFPLLFKGDHSSASQAIFKFNNVSDLKSFTDTLADNEKIILQELVEMRRDMRVTIVGGEIFSSFWRINTESEWRVTASSMGSLIRFENLEDKWKNYVLDVSRKCKLPTCGIDICFENDDTNNLPLILEISPRFSLNPNYDLSKVDYEYKEYKKKVFIKNSYRFLQTKELMHAASIFVDYYLKNNNFLN